MNLMNDDIVLVGNQVKIYRTFWCNPIPVTPDMPSGCGKSFEIDQDKLMSAVVPAKRAGHNVIYLECPNCGHRIAKNIYNGFSLSEFPYRIVRCD